MKILSLSFQNLNALKGKWHIDFEREPFVSSGLFAITGPTGAGKTTLLDALCLALYHKTPRQPKQSDEQHALMTRGTGVMAASVCFESQGQRYVASWQLRRARQQADGKPQPAEVSLSKNGELITDKISEKQAQLIAITGLDFTRFTQSMLLAQGGFAAFLQAKENERAALLEELTGTDIYSQLSQRAYQKAKAARERIQQKRDQLNIVTQVDPQQFAEAEQATRDCEQRIDALGQQIKQSQAQLTQRQHYHQARQALVEQREALSALLLSWQAAQPDFDRLERSVQAEACLGDYRALDAARETLAQQQQALDQRQQSLQTLVAKQGPCEQQLQQAGEALAKAKAEKSRAQSDIEALRECERQLADHRQQGQQEAKRLSECQAAQAKHQQQCQAVQAEQHTLVKRREQIDAALTQRPDDHQLLEHRADWQSRLQRLEQDSARWHERQAEQHHALVRVEALQQALDQCQVNRQRQAREWAEQERGYQQQLSVFDDLDLPDERQALEQAQAAVQQQLSALSQATQQRKLQDELSQVAQTIEQDQQRLDAVMAQQQALSDQAEPLEQRYQQACLARDLQQYRDQLQRGEPCPLCGACEHPKLDQSEPDQQGVLASAEQAWRQHRSAQQAVMTEKAQLEAALGAHQKTRAALSEQLAHRAEPELGEALQVEALDAEALAQLLAQRQVMLERAQARLQQFDQREQQRRAWQPQLERHTQTLNQLDQQQHEQHYRLRDQQQQAERLQRESLQQHEAIQRDQQALSQALQSHLDQAVAVSSLSELSQAIEHLAKRAVEHQRLVQQQCDLAGEERGLQLRLERVRQQAEQSTFAAEQAQQALKQREQHIDELQAEKHHRFADKQAASWQQSLDQRLDLALEQYDNARQRLSQQQSEQAVAAEAVKLYTQQQLDAKHRLTQAEQHWQSVLGRSGFSDQAALLAAVLPSEQRHALSEKKSALQNQRLSVSSRLEALEASCQRQLEEAPDLEQPLEPLSEWIGTLSSERDQQLSEKATLKAQLGQWQQDIERYQRHQRELQSLEYQAEDWQWLNELIGSEKGDKFRRFAQGLTLENLLVYANNYLQKLDGRYRLVRTPEQLQLAVVDTWQADHTRAVNTLSGGESFLVSLALALGLSDLVSDKAQIDSLFLDEGFGTLDPAALDVVLDALDGLNDSGKTIGIISHVEALKERIAVRIQVNKSGGVGYSRLGDQFVARD